MSFWKTLGKIGAFAAPIVAAPFTGGASLALIGAGAGAAGGALSGGGLKGALLGGALGGASGGLLGGAGGGAASAASGAGGKVGGNILSQIGSSALNSFKSDPLGAISKVGGVLGSQGKASAEQRLAETPGQVAAYNANLNGMQLQDKRAALASLLGGGLQDAHVQMPNGSTIPQFNISGGLRPSAMNHEALLKQYSQHIDPLKLPQAGTMEKVLGGAGMATSILGALGGMGKGASPQAPQQTGQPPAPYMPPDLLHPKAGGGLSAGFVDPRTYGGVPRPGVMY